MTTAQQRITATGRSYLNSNPSSILGGSINSDGNGLGVVSTFESTPEHTQINGNFTYTEFLQLVMTQALSYANTLSGAYWEIDINNLSSTSNELLELRTDVSTPLASSSTQIGFYNLGGSISTVSNLTGLSNVLYILPLTTDNNLPVAFQLYKLRFIYDDGCPESGCDAPEPGMLGLLGFSLAGLAFLRRKQ